MNVDEQIKSINQLCKSYGFKELRVTNISSMYRFNQKYIEDAYQAAKLYQLLQVCKSTYITIAGKITKPQKGMIRGTDIKTDIFSSIIEKGVMDTLKEQIYIGCVINKEEFSKAGIDIQNIKPCDLEYIINKLAKMMKKLEHTENGHKGWYLYDLSIELEKIAYFPKDCNKTRKYSFLYDYCVLIGEANNIGEGYSGSIGKEKYTQVRNWINAYKKQISDNLKFMPDGSTTMKW